MKNYKLLLAGMIYMVLLSTACDDNKDPGIDKPGTPSIDPKEITIQVGEAGKEFIIEVKAEGNTFESKADATWLTTTDRSGSFRIAAKEEFYYGEDSPQTRESTVTVEFSDSDPLTVKVIQHGTLRKDPLNAPYMKFNGLANNEVIFTYEQYFLEFDIDTNIEDYVEEAIFTHDYELNSNGPIIDIVPIGMDFTQDGTQLQVWTKQVNTGTTPYDLNYTISFPSIEGMEDIKIHVYQEFYVLPEDYLSGSWTVSFHDHFLTDQDVSVSNRLNISYADVMHTKYRWEIPNCQYLYGGSSANIYFELEEGQFRVRTKDYGQKYYVYTTGSYVNWITAPMVQQIVWIDGQGSATLGGADDYMVVMKDPDKEGDLIFKPSNEPAGMTMAIRLWVDQYQHDKSDFVWEAAPVGILSNISCTPYDPGPGPGIPLL